MYPLGHFGMALLFAAPVAALLHPRTQTGFTLYTLVAAWLPDVDTYIPGVIHRGIMHTVTFAVGAAVGGGVVAAVTVIVARKLTRNELIEQFDPVPVFVFVSLGILLGMVSHLIADILVVVPGTEPVSPFWPITEQAYQFEITRLGAPVRNAVLILLGLGIHAVVSWRASPEAGRTLSTTKHMDSAPEVRRR